MYWQTYKSDKILMGHFINMFTELSTQLLTAFYYNQNNHYEKEKMIFNAKSTKETVALIK